MAEQVEADAAVLQHGLLHCRLPPQQGTQVRQQFLEAERLGQIVVGAEVEALDAVLDRVARAEDHHRFVEAGLAPFAQQVEPVAVGQAQVEHDGVVTGFAQGIARLAAGRCPGCGIAALGQPLLQELTQAAFILHDQYFHGLRRCVAWFQSSAEFPGPCLTEKSFRKPSG